MSVDRTQLIEGGWDSVEEMAKELVEFAGTQLATWPRESTRERGLEVVLRALLGTEGSVDLLKAFGQSLQGNEGAWNLTCIGKAIEALAEAEE